MVRACAAGRVPSVAGGTPRSATRAIVAASAMVICAESGHVGVRMVIAPLLGTALAVMAYWFHWVLPRGLDYAPLNYTAAQMAAAAKRAERLGFRRGRAEAKRRAKSDRSGSRRNDGDGDRGDDEDAADEDDVEAEANNDVNAR